MPSSPPLVAAMARGSANALDRELADWLDGRLDEAERDGRPLVLTGSGRFFCPGLNLVALPSERAGMGAFADAFEDLLLRLYDFPCPTVAAVNGHAVAGGAILAACCDWRIGAEGDYRVGVSETSLGIAFPAAAFEIVRATVPPHRQTEVMLAGRLLPPDEAIGAGFLHETAPADELVERAGERAEEMGALPRDAFVRSKRELRATTIRRARENREKSRERFLDTWFSEEAAARRAAILKRD